MTSKVHCSELFPEKQNHTNPPNHILLAFSATAPITQNPSYTSPSRQHLYQLSLPHRPTPEVSLTVAVKSLELEDGKSGPFLSDDLRWEEPESRITYKLKQTLLLETEMETSVRLDLQAFKCAVCLGLLRSPEHWDREEQRQKNRQRSTSMSAVLCAEELLSTPGSGQEHHASVFSRGANQSRLQTAEDTAVCALLCGDTQSPEESVQRSGDDLGLLIRLLEQIRTQVEQQIKVQQQTLEGAVTELQKELQLELTTLCRNLVHIDFVAHTPDDNQFFRLYPELKQSKVRDLLRLGPVRSYFSDL
ncbi:hypothetical protein WMY93_008870 [Mugilogobius chulae]|uniref:TRIM8/14/16/25/29/45/65 coiled-coil region domain-containing protein n=1 Tax=Mugilogobius chulae TaxID=88201 RepID=A0AAW0PDE8_9GOBI